jgi:5-methylthioribose kinase
MVAELLDESSVLSYLLQKKVISDLQSTRVEILTGGVSNFVIAISTPENSYVLKQALPELKVKVKWEADQRRAIVEGNALKLFHQITPEHVPHLIFCDSERFVLVLERISEPVTVWKSDLLSGLVNVEVAKTLGLILATWHNYTATHPETMLAFQEDTLFDQLRIDPFYRYVAAKNPDLQLRISGLIYSLKTVKDCIVHGDYSPKNVLVQNQDHVYVIDFEVAHHGNPIFDLAFLLAHLLCKFFATEDDEVATAIYEAACAFLANYLARRSISPDLGWHVALIALARIEGKSPVNYLSPKQQIKLGLHTKRMLANQAPDLDGLFDPDER